MNDIDRRILQIYEVILENETNFNSLLCKLQTKENIITPYLLSKYEKLLKNGTTEKLLNRELYRDIQTRGKKAFHSLIQCLTEVHPHLADLLSPDERFQEETSTENKPTGFVVNDQACSEYEGICTLTKSGSHQNKFEIDLVVKMLCHSIRAIFIKDERHKNWEKKPSFYIFIKAEGKFDERDLIVISRLFTNHPNLKIIIISITSSEEMDNTTEDSVIRERSKSDKDPAAAFIVNIHIHKGDHVPSIINIIREVVSHNRDYEIRDIFRVVMEKLAKWGCRLNTESRAFPKFYF